MNGLYKRRLLLAGGGLALLSGYYASPPIADIRITRDIAGTAMSQIETKVDLGFVAFSYLYSWGRARR